MSEMEAALVEYQYEGSEEMIAADFDDFTAEEVVYVTEHKGES